MLIKIIKSFIYILLMMLIINNYAEARRHFSVEDGINRTVLYDTVPNSFSSRPFYVSNDGGLLFLVIGTGDASKNSYLFKLIMFESDKVIDFIGKSRSFKPKIIESIWFKQGDISFGRYDNAGIKNISISKDSQSVFFIAPDAVGVFQVFQVQLANLKKKQLTFGEKHVNDYVIIGDERFIIYSENAENRSYDCEKVHFRVGTRPLGEAICLRNGLSLYENYYIAQPTAAYSSIYVRQLIGESVPQLVAKSVKIGSALSDIVMSPDNKLGVIEVEEDKITPKLTSEESETDWLQNSMRVFDPDIMRPWPIYRYYALINISEPSLRILNKFPISGHIKENAVLWRGNDQVYFRNIDVENVEGGDLLHYDVVSDSMGMHRNYQINRVLYSYSRHKFYYISGGVRPAIKSDSQFSSIHDEKGNRASMSSKCSRTVSGEGDELESGPACYVEHRQFGIKYYLKEKYNIPPSIFAVDLRSGREKKIYELNPQFSDIRFGRTDLINWVDKNGRKWNAGIVFPPNYDKRKRYPLVIQLHGFDQNIFLIDGPFYGTAPFAAQALASKEIIVVQMPNPAWMKHSRQLPAMASGVSSLVKLLDIDRIIDKKKIGIIAFSARGPLAFNMLIFPDFKISAAVIADSLSPSPWGYSLSFGLPPIGMLTQEFLNCGAQPWGDKKSEWIRRNPYFHLEKMNTPVLLKEYTPLLTTWWDIYAGLRRLKKPVDFRIFTSGGHPPTQIDTILSSQRMTIAWFDFWLNDKEPANLVSGEDYLIWREMREKVGADLNGQNLGLSDMDCSNDQDIPNL